MCPKIRSHYQRAWPFLSFEKRTTLKIAFSGSFIPSHPLEGYRLRPPRVDHIFSAGLVLNQIFSSTPSRKEAAGKAVRDRNRARARVRVDMYPRGRKPSLSALSRPPTSKPAPQLQQLVGAISGSPSLTLRQPRCSVGRGSVRHDLS